MIDVSCARMEAGTRSDALGLLESFLRDDAHYLASSAAYGDGGLPALEAALDLFLSRPGLGFVWLGYAGDHGARIAVGACVVCYAISTSCGGIVAKLDDVTVREGWQARGVGSAMLQDLIRELASKGVRRIDTACHRDNAAAWRFYERIGFKSLHEERIALLL